MLKGYAAKPLLVVPFGVSLAVLSTQAFGQEALRAPRPPSVALTDENGVDPFSGTKAFSITDASIGGLAHIKTILSYDPSTQPEPNANTSPPELDNYIGGLGYSDARDYTNDPNSWSPRPRFTVRVAGISAQLFINRDGSLQSFSGDSLTGNGVNGLTAEARPQPVVLGGPQGIWNLTTGSGVVVEIDTSRRPKVGTFTQYLGLATKISYPDGKIIRMNYRADCTNNPRLQSVTGNDGFMLKYAYEDSSCGARMTGVIAINLANETCDPFADACSVDPKWRRSQYTYSFINGRNVTDVIDQAGSLSRFTFDKWGRVLGYRPANATRDLMTFTYCPSYWTRINYTTDGTVPTMSTDPNDAYSKDASETYCGESTYYGTYGSPYQWSTIYNRIASIMRADQNFQWGYGLPRKLAPNDSPYPRQYQVTRPTGLPVVVSVWTGTGGGMTDYADPSKLTANFDGSNEARRIRGLNLRGQPAMTFTYDGRGNITSDGVSSAGFEASCSFIARCNKPLWTRDPAGFQSDYEYDPTHGGVLTETLPPDANGIRPQKRYSYVQRYAWFRNSGGALVRSAEPIWLLSSMRFCRTSASVNGGCSVAGDEVVTTYDYGPDSGPNNLWLRGAVVSADGQSLRTCFGYNKFGEKISETTPRAGLAVCQ